MIRDEFKPILTGFTLSFRDIEKMLAARGVLVSSETIQQGSLKCGQTYANSLRRKAPATASVAQSITWLQGYWQVNFRIILRA